MLKRTRNRTTMRAARGFLTDSHVSGDDKPAEKPELSFDDRPGQAYRAPSQAGPGNDINARSPGLHKAPTRGPASLVAADCYWGTVFLARSRVIAYFRATDLFGRSDFLLPTLLGGLRASFTAFPAWNRTALLAGILILSPVCGFRPSRAGRAATLKVPRPETRTGSPATRDSRTACTTAFTASAAAVWVSIVF